MSRSTSRSWGGCRPTTMSSLIRESDLFTLPTLRDGPPFVLLEAMAVGLPVLCLDLGSTAELVPESAGFKMRAREPRVRGRGDRRGARVPRIRTGACKGDGSARTGRRYPRAWMEQNPRSRSRPRTTMPSARSGVRIRRGSLAGEARCNLMNLDGLRGACHHNSVVRVDNRTRAYPDGRRVFRCRGRCSGRVGVAASPSLSSVRRPLEASASSARVGIDVPARCEHDPLDSDAKRRLGPAGTDGESARTS